MRGRQGTEKKYFAVRNEQGEVVVTGTDVYIVGKNTEVRLEILAKNKEEISKEEHLKQRREIKLRDDEKEKRSKKTKA